MQRLTTECNSCKVRLFLSSLNYISLAEFPSTYFLCTFSICADKQVDENTENLKKSQNITKQFLCLREVEKFVYRQRVNANKYNENRFSE